MCALSYGEAEGSHRSFVSKVIKDRNSDFQIQKFIDRSTNGEISYKVSVKDGKESATLLYMRDDQDPNRLALFWDRDKDVPLKSVDLELAMKNIEDAKYLYYLTKENFDKNRTNRIQELKSKLQSASTNQKEIYRSLALQQNKKYYKVGKERNKWLVKSHFSSIEDTIPAAKNYLNKFFGEGWIFKNFECNSYGGGWYSPNYLLVTGCPNSRISLAFTRIVDDLQRYGYASVAVNLIDGKIDEVRVDNNLAFPGVVQEDLKPKISEKDAYLKAKKYFLTELMDHFYRSYFRDIYKEQKKNGFYKQFRKAMDKIMVEKYIQFNEDDIQLEYVHAKTQIPSGVLTPSKAELMSDRDRICYSCPFRLRFPESIILQDVTVVYIDAVDGTVVFTDDFSFKIRNRYLSEKYNTMSKNAKQDTSPYSSMKLIDDDFRSEMKAFLKSKIKEMEASKITND